MRLSASAHGVLLLAVVYLTLSVCFSAVGPSYITILSPTIGWAVEHAVPDLVVRSVTVHGQTLAVTFAELRELGLHNGPDTTAKGAIQVLYSAPVIALSLITAWPNKSIGTRVLGHAFAFAPLALLPMLHFPTLMLAPMFEDQAAHRLFWFWFFCVSNGGPQLVAVLVAWFAISASDRVSDVVGAWVSGAAPPVGLAARTTELGARQPGGLKAEGQAGGRAAKLQRFKAHPRKRAAKSRGAQAHGRG